MGAELSKPNGSSSSINSTSTSSGTVATTSGGSSLRRVGSSSTLEKQGSGSKNKTNNSSSTTGGSNRLNKFPTSASSINLSTMATATDTASPSITFNTEDYQSSHSNFSTNGINTQQQQVLSRRHSGAALSQKLMDSSFFQSIRGRSSSRTATETMMSSPLTGTTNTTTTTTTTATTTNGGEEHAVELLDLPTIEWEGYVTKRGHLVRNWKSRFFQLEGNHLSYYENKEHARDRSHLKGRVYIASVKAEKGSKMGHGYDFSFETTEGKVFHCCVPTAFEQVMWVYFMEAGVDCSNMRRNSKPIYKTYRHGAMPDMKTEAAYTLYRRLMMGGGDIQCTKDFLAYFNKDLVFTANYPKTTPFYGDFFGREGLLHFVGNFYHHVEILELTISHVSLTQEDNKMVTIKGHEKIKSRFTGAIINHPFTHRIRYGPYGRILRLKMDVDNSLTSGNWSTFGFGRQVYSEESDLSVRTTRSLSISMKDFTVYNVIGKGGFGTVVNAVKKSDGQIYALKILEKNKMTKYDIESSFTEMRVAQNIHHPFIAGLRIAFQSRTKLFLGMNYYGGGDLFHHMSKGATCRIASARAHFYTAELVLGIHHLHQHDILYRDIKPENVMIDSDGHIALVDFGLAKLHVSDYKGAKTMAGSPQYTAPELLLPKAKRSYGKAADWWSLGILLYEMSVGKSPFYDSNLEKMYEKIQHDELSFPSKPVLSEELKDILRGFLQKDPTKRLGSKITDILTHAFFSGLDWDLLLQKKVTPPWKPNLSSPLDVGYVDAEFTDLDVQREVQSPTEKNKSKSKGGFFLSNFVSGRGHHKNKHNGAGGASNSGATSKTALDPTFKDFTYFCEDPDALVEVNHLVDELHTDGNTSITTPVSPPPPPPPGATPSSSSSTGEAAAFTSPKPIVSNTTKSGSKSGSTTIRTSLNANPTGTPLSSFLESGHLNPPDIHFDLKQLEICSGASSISSCSTASTPLPSPPHGGSSSNRNSRNSSQRSIPAPTATIAAPVGEAEQVTFGDVAVVEAQVVAEPVQQESEHEEEAKELAVIQVPTPVVDAAHPAVRPLEVTVFRDPTPKSSSFSQQQPTSES